MSDLRRHLRIQGDCPLEHQVAFALDAAAVSFAVDGELDNRTGLDFYLPQFDLYIEVKSGYTPRIADQTSRKTNIIVVQGMRSVNFLCNLLQKSA